jgi:hypothetical protein
MVSRPRSQTRHMRHRRPTTSTLAALLGSAFFAAGIVAAGQAAADKIKQPIAVFSGLDKITGRIIIFEVAANETVQFGSLQITERVCYSRPPTEAPQTDTFLEIDNIDADNNYKRVFSGWMFAGSPSLHALDHPVYDIWLLRCKGNGELISEPAAVEAPVPAPGPLQPPAEPVKPAPAKPRHGPNNAGPNNTGPSNAETQPPPPTDTAPIEVGPPPGFSQPGEQPAPTRPFTPASPAPDTNGIY